uniref:Uncharacterized protein n=1 Tax=Cyprinus carpio TaxID=7962 RepID=A0A8C2K3V1_CYPCA
MVYGRETFNSQATALVDIPAVSMPIACSLKTCDICGIVLCDKTAHFRVACYCGQPKFFLLIQCLLFLNVPYLKTTKLKNSTNNSLISVVYSGGILYKCRMT